jgi:hypothetical protein
VAGWHKCAFCEEPSSYQCLCCPDVSVCVSLAKKGFCVNCIKNVTILERNIDVSDEVTKGIFFMNYCQV